MTWVDPWVGKIPWRRESLPTLVFWPGEFYGLYSPCSLKELGMTEWLSLHFTSTQFSYIFTSFPLGCCDESHSSLSGVLIPSATERAANESPQVTVSYRDCLGCRDLQPRQVITPSLSFLYPVIDWLKCLWKDPTLLLEPQTALNDHHIFGTSRRRTETSVETAL